MYVPFGRRIAPHLSLPCQLDYRYLHAAEGGCLCKVRLALFLGRGLMILIGGVCGWNGGWKRKQEPPVFLSAGRSSILQRPPAEGKIPRNHGNDLRQDFLSTAGQVCENVLLPRAKRFSVLIVTYSSPRDIL